MLSVATYCKLLSNDKANVLAPVSAFHSNNLAQSCPTLRLDTPRCLVLTFGSFRTPTGIRHSAFLHPNYGPLIACRE